MRLNSKQLEELIAKGRVSRSKAVPRGSHNSDKTGNTSALRKPSAQKSLCGTFAAQLKMCGIEDFRWEEHPDGEYQFHPTRKWRLDFYFPAFDVAVEVEGGVANHRMRKAVSKDGEAYYQQSRHLTPEGFENDAVKYFEATKAGISVIRVTSKMVSDGRAASMLIQLLESRGWVAEPSKNELVGAYRGILRH